MNISLSLLWNSKMKRRKTSLSIFLLYSSRWLAESRVICDIKIDVLTKQIKFTKRLIKKERKVFIQERWIWARQSTILYSCSLLSKTATRNGLFKSFRLTTKSELIVKIFRFCNNTYPWFIRKSHPTHLLLRIYFVSCYFYLPKLRSLIISDWESFIRMYAEISLHDFNVILFVSVRSSERAEKALFTRKKFNYILCRCLVKIV